MDIAFVEEWVFARVRDALFGDDESFRAFQTALEQNPRAGDTIPHCAGARKVRWADPRRGKGKRGGIRVIYFYNEEAAMIYLLFAYDKNISDLTEKQKKALRELIERNQKGEAR